MENEFPVATVREAGWLATARRIGVWWWLAAALCLVFAVVLSVSAIDTGGLSITIKFADGYGLEEGHALKHRGIEIGEVTSVDLDETLDGVIVTVRLKEDATRVASAGSDFWIARPQVSLARVTGLETVVGAKHLRVRTANQPGERQVEFTGLEAPPVLADAAGGSVTIQFEKGHGLATGDVVKHRGIVVGEVTGIDLTPDLDGVLATVALRASSRSLARRGTQFWIERPRVGLSGVHGLDTVVRGVYIEVAPGPAGGETLDRFVGQEDPPLLVEREVGGLEIILEGKQRYGVDSGSPVTYRGLRVGRIVSVRLSSDSSVVEARAYIEPAFRGLVRENSVFWSTSGIDVKVGVTGVRLDYDTLATIAAGGVSMATPPAGGEPVSTGKRFDLEPKVKDGWLEYTPRIPVGSALLPPGVSAPQALRVSLHWRTGSIVRRNRDRLGWALPLTGNRLLGLAEVLHPDPEAEKATAGFELEIDGKRLPLDPQKSKALASLAVLALADALPTEQSVWPDDRIRRPSEPEECLIAPGQTDLAPLTVAQLQAGDGVWRIDPSIALNDDWHGAPVVSASDGAVIGFVTVSDDGAQVELAPQLQ